MNIGANTSGTPQFTVTATGPELVPDTQYDVRFTTSPDKDNFKGGVGGGNALCVDDGTGNGVISKTFSYHLARITSPGTHWVKTWIENQGSDPSNPNPIGGFEAVFPITVL